MKKLIILFALMMGVNGFGQNVLTVNNNTPNTLIIVVAEDEDPCIPTSSVFRTSYSIAPFQTLIFTPTLTSGVGGGGGDLFFGKVSVYDPTQYLFSLITVYTNAPYRSVVGVPSFIVSLAGFYAVWNSSPSVSPAPSGRPAYLNVVDIN